MGLLDYSSLNSRIASFNMSVETFRPLLPYDAIYCISVLALMPTPVREATLRLCQAWLKPGAKLVLAIDLIPGTDTLWNLGGSEESPEEHGTWRDVEHQLQDYGFQILESRIERGVYRSPVDLHFLIVRR